MTADNLQIAINLIKTGKKAEGIRLLRFALRDADLTTEQRISAYIWWARTTDILKDRISAYQAVVQIAPNHPEANQMLAELTRNEPPPIPDAPRPTTIPESSPPPPPAQLPEQPQPTEQPIQPTTWTEPKRQSKPDVGAPIASPIGYNDLSTPQNPAPLGRPVEKASRSTGQHPIPAQGTLHRTVGIFGGLNGDGTGFFVSLDGIVATTRHIVGGSAEIAYEVSGGRRETGAVLRAFPQFDLAFVQTQVRLGQLLPISSSPIIPDNMPLNAITYSKRSTNGSKRATTSTFKPEWFPTTIDTLGDAGGNPVFNDRGLLVGMLTANASRTAPYVFGLYIHVIFNLLEHYQQETRQNPNAIYCGGCGNLSVAGNYGGFYCEHCGTILRQAQGTHRERFARPEMNKLYGETMSPACLMCGSTSGYHAGKCLRCGHQHNQKI